ncbi:MAG: hypothetical protein J6S41_06530 [Clostridia bacterium]|nr:hypothetical protein [Clostridia bacterium]
MAKDEKTIRFGKVSFGGYKPEEVDEYITSLKVELEEQRARVADLTDKLRYLVRVVEEMQQGGADVPPAAAPAPAPAPAQKDDGTEKATELLAAIRTRLTETAESVAALFGAELAAYSELAASLEKKAEAETAPVRTEKEPAVEAPVSVQTEEPAPAEAVEAESLTFDTMSLESLRKDIDDLAEEKYIPGQEDPTIVASDLKSILVRPVTGHTEPAEPAVTEKEDVAPVNEEKNDDADDDVHFSLFKRR